MSEMKMVMPDRVKVTVSDKKDQKFVSIGIEKDVPEGVDYQVVVDDVYNTAATMLQAKISEVPDPAPKSFSKPSGGYNKPQGGYKKKYINNGICSECNTGNRVAVSKKGNEYCGCWYDN